MVLEMWDYIKYLKVSACKSYEMHEALRTSLKEVPYCLGEEDIIPLSSNTVVKLSSQKTW